MSHRRVTNAQLETLFECLNSNRSLATGFNKTAQAREQHRRMWSEVTILLNSYGDGANKDWKAWSKYWNDYKSKLKSKAAAGRASHERTGGGRPCVNNEISEVEKNFLQILGPDYGAGLPGARVEPFIRSDEDFTDAETGSPSIILGTVQNYHQVVTENDNTDEALDASPPATNSEARPQAAARLENASVSPPLARVQSVEPPLSLPAARSNVANLTPHRRAVLPNLRRRRDNVLTQSAARRSLISIAQRREQLELQRNQVLERILEELREVKNALLTRRI